MLAVQYRMHAAIMEWSSLAMYGGELVAAPSVCARRLADLPGVSFSSEADATFDAEALSSTLALIDTSGCGFEESADEEEALFSRSNDGEALAAAMHVNMLLQAGLDARDIAVISPYNGQVALLREMLFDAVSRGLEVRSVDGFQGREKEAVVLSLVRSNPRCEVGFLGDDRRLNVAITRAKRHVALVCDTATIREEFVSLEDGGVL